jgi:antitoxin ParD1/3/4
MPSSVMMDPHPMKSMNISLPAPMRDWVEAQVKGGSYASASDYVRDLIRKDREYISKREALLQALIEGEESGISNKSIEEVIAEARAEMANEEIHHVRKVG